MQSQERRPDPDLLLNRVREEEARTARGKLKIFLGYAAGVGKTYAMLEAGHQRRAEGVDVVIGCVETHGRAETEMLLHGFEIIARRQVAYRGVTLEEMDVDAILNRRPQLVLIDELAHTNVPGSRHPKRYHDVEELLAAGIDVYTTLNIQHLESLNDVVAQITGVQVRETLPDRMLDTADEIALIDLPTVELRQRLAQGKVYIPEQATQAAEKFFRAGNLTALRELALRRAAERVDEQMRAYMQTRAIPGPWPAGERLLVCVSASPLSERLVRAARRLATRLDAEWFALYVDTPDARRLSTEEQERIAHHLNLAEELGAQAITLSGTLLAETVVRYAHNQNITKIIAGKPLRAQWWDILSRRSLVDEIIQKSGDIDVYVISGVPGAEKKPVSSVPPRGPVDWTGFLEAGAIVMLVTLLAQPFRPYIDPVNVVMFYLLGILITALRHGRGPSSAAAILSVMAFNFFFVLPYYTFVVAEAQYLITFAALFTVGMVVSVLAARLRDQAIAAQQREAQVANIFELSRDLAAASDLHAVAQAIVYHVSRIQHAQVALYLLRQNTLTLFHSTPDYIQSPHEEAVARWAYEHKEPAGRFTNTLPNVAVYYVPLINVEAVVGVLGIRLPDEVQVLLPNTKRLVSSLANQATLATQRVQLAEQAQQVQLFQARDSLQSAILNSISHDLRTPLAAVMGALSSLREAETPLDEHTKQELLDNAWAETARLNRLVGNLLDMSRLESGAFQINLAPCDVQDMVSVALEQLGDRVRGREIQMEIPDTLPLVSADFVLVVQVLVNLLDNAIKYAPPVAPVKVWARAQTDVVEIGIADRGPGIEPADLPYVFDKFYRGHEPGDTSGAGLGLAIVKGIVEAHAGSVEITARPGGGTIVMFTLLIAQIPSQTRGPTVEIEHD